MVHPLTEKEEGVEVEEELEQHLQVIELLPLHAMRGSIEIAMKMDIEEGITDMRGAIVEEEGVIITIEAMGVMMVVKVVDIMNTEEIGVIIDKIITEELKVVDTGVDKGSIEEGHLDSSKLVTRLKGN